MRYLLIGGLLILSAGAASCRSTGSSDADPPALSVAPGVPEDLRILFGQGGGYTGQWTGFTIEADGTVWSWKGRTAGENVDSAGTLPAADVAALWQEIEAAGFFENSTQEYGNMTAVLEVTADSVVHRVSWPPRLAGVEPLTESHEHLYVRCHEVVRRALAP